MNGPTHRLAGAVSAFALTQIDTDDNTSVLHHPVVAIPVGAYLGRLPDMIEPALGNPNHRQFFHSMVVFGTVALGLKKAYEWEPEDNLEKTIRGLLLIGGAAYISHLVLDAVTKKSLPIVGKI